MSVNPAGKNKKRKRARDQSFIPGKAGREESLSPLPPERRRREKKWKRKFPIFPPMFFFFLLSFIFPFPLHPYVLLHSLGSVEKIFSPSLGRRRSFPRGRKRRGKNPTAEKQGFCRHRPLFCSGQHVIHPIDPKWHNKLNNDRSIFCNLCCYAWKRTKTWIYVLVCSECIFMLQCPPGQETVELGAGMKASASCSRR